MTMIMIWGAFSWLFSAIGMEALRGATIPVSGTFMSYFEILIHLFPACSVVYALLSIILFEVDPNSEIKDNPTYKCMLKSLEDHTIKIESAFAICAASLQYLGFSVNIWIFSLVFAAWLLLYGVKPDLFFSKTPICWLLATPRLFYPKIFIASMFFLVPCFQLLVIAPYFNNLIATSPMAARAYGRRRYIEIVCGMLGNALTAYYLRFQSSSLMLAFLSFAIASLGIFANVKPSTDFGIIQFLVTSSIQCAVILFGLLHVYTFLILLSGCAVMVLRWKIASGHFAGPKSWVGKLCPYPKETERVIAYLGSTLLLLPALFKASGNTHPFILLGSLALYSAVLREKFLSLKYSARKEIYSSVWKWRPYWHGFGNGINPSGLFYYIHFRDILHLFVRHMCHHPNYEDRQCKARDTNQKSRSRNSPTPRLKLPV